MNIETQQQYIIETMQDELNKTSIAMSPSSYRHSVWFDPKQGLFIFNDYCVKYEVIYPLIEDGTLIYKAFELHQGEKMLRYVLA